MAEILDKMLKELEALKEQGETDTNFASGLKTNKLLKSKLEGCAFAYNMAYIILKPLVDKAIAIDESSAIPLAV